MKHNRTDIFVSELAAVLDVPVLYCGHLPNDVPQHHFCAESGQSVPDTARACARLVHMEVNRAMKPCRVMISIIYDSGKCNVRYFVQPILPSKL